MATIEGNQRKPTMVKIRVTDSKISVESTYTIWAKKKENGKTICAIPEFNIYFSVHDENAIDKKAKTFLDIFFGYYFESKNKYSLRKLAVNLHRLGFKPHNNPSGMVNMIKNKPDKNTAFRMDALARPEDFEMASALERSSTFAAHA